MRFYLIALSGTGWEQFVLLSAKTQQNCGVFTCALIMQTDGKKYKTKEKKQKLKQKGGCRVHTDFFAILNNTQRQMYVI